MSLLKNWRQKLGALLVAGVIWYLIKEHLQRRGGIPPVYDYVPGQAMGLPEPGACDPAKHRIFSIHHVS